MLTSLVLSLALLWDFDRMWTPAPDAFLLTATQAGAPTQQYRVAFNPPGACQRLDAEALDAFCTLLACPTAGTVVAFWVQAVASTGTSVPSNIATCWFPPGEAGCHCHDPQEAIPPQPVSPPPPPNAPLLSTVVPPLPQRSAEGLHLLPIGDLPLLPVVPPVPATTAM
jgi:hypothetical protein